MKLNNFDTIILGGGMVGQLAKFLFPKAVVLDWRPVAPRDPHLNGAKQFGAQYLWEPLEGIDCHSFEVRTTIDGSPESIENAIRYKHKIGKPADVSLSDTSWMRQFAHIKTGYAITSLPPAEVKWGVYIDAINLEERHLHSRAGDYYSFDHLISCIPLPHLMALVGGNSPHREFKAKAICVKVGNVPLDCTVPPTGVVRVNYISDPNVACYRTTDRFDERHYEWLRGAEGASVPAVASKVITPGKIWPHAESEQWVQFFGSQNVHCYGRFGAWRPDELLHQTYNYLRVLRTAFPEM